MLAPIVEFHHIHYDSAKCELGNVQARDIEAIRQAITNQQVVVLKRAFDPKMLKVIRAAVFQKMMTTEVSNPEIRENSPNFFRIDDNPEKSAVKRIKQLFCSFYWNDDVAGETQLMRAMSRFRNIIAELDVHYTLEGIEDDGYMTYANISHYPVGSGMLNKHQDPPNKQFSVIIASLSEKGSDFSEGGLFIDYHGKKVCLDDFLELGDIYLMNPQVPHGVDPIDPASVTQWRSEKGRWILFPALIELKTTKGEKVAGLKDLGAKIPRK